ncbi:MAG: L-glutamate gamma-semialdehyde dehydrogenase [Bacteroidales bacterium]|jgi:1-pyrroline-5-carboxylate dehydrogenase|nr:L-glutamate gamma-semialdehyde dehydrogenase [Bacteroidales bacterium]HNT41092.1 L-glutamate gamma-semialdehyde dehydrogenase [Tenuifilaceae bacterium]MBP8643211.1 L-glutamate gamma-semialdehyde dehydrogenase [Bacteroidales bacterium]NLI88753.1 L-glutamate gamma-semialdehyde dehydrogenase [Bacteroidales bacterium]HOG71916.1 L-glutamate gamma-semialdehyde dehydrogenase [Tenuifilaceae bacterium]
MNNAIFKYDFPKNEPILGYLPGSPERLALEAEIKKLSSEVMDIPLIIGGKEVRTGKTGKVVMPHDHQHVLANYHIAGEEEVKMAIEAALKAHEYWGTVSWVERLSITVKAAELLSTKYRALINAATMLGQDKNVYQAEIDSACEAIDFLRFNAYYISEVYNHQPSSDKSSINRLEYRPLEGFVFAVTPFNFTAIASNLNMSPVLMGNTVVWKPATTAILSNYILMKVYKEAGLPDGVINFIPGKGSAIGNIVLNHPMLAGIHFTGSTATFNQFWKTVSNNIGHYRSYPKLIGETGGKDFMFLHSSANINEAVTAAVRGAFEFQGQKCSAASRAYIPQSLWPEFKSKMTATLKEIKQGDPTDYETFINAVIDEASFDNIMQYINQAKTSDKAEIIWGGKGDKSRGYFVEPTVILTTDPHFVTMEEEIFGPVLTIYVYPDNKFNETLEICNSTSPYALTGAIFATDRMALNHACRVLRYAAGNLYFNDKPTGAVVGQQPFGGARASGTNDKAGGPLNLIRWTSPRTIKENLIPPVNYKYPYMTNGDSK